MAAEKGFSLVTLSVDQVCEYLKAKGATDQDVQKVKGGGFNGKILNTLKGSLDSLVGRLGLSLDGVKLLKQLTQEKEPIQIGKTDGNTPTNKDQGKEKEPITSGKINGNATNKDQDKVKVLLVLDDRRTPIDVLPNIDATDLIAEAEGVFTTPNLVLLEFDEFFGIEVERHHGTLSLKNRDQLKFKVVKKKEEPEPKKMKSEADEPDTVKIFLELKDKEQEFVVKPNIDVEDLLVLARDKFNVSDLRLLEYDEEFEEYVEKHGTLSLKNGDKMKLKDLTTKEESEPKPKQTGDDELSCISIKKYNDDNPQQSSEVAEWMPHSRIWKNEDETVTKTLYVYFLPSGANSWKYQKSPIVPDIILSVAKSWEEAGIKLEQTRDRDEAHIRVLLEGGSGGSWSKLGNEARRVDDKNKPTMVLNFDNMKDDDEIKTIIIHQFGHALGLGHSLQRPENWKILEKYVRKEKMMESYGLKDPKKFEVQWSGLAESDQFCYQKESAMQYFTKVAWLKDSKYDDPNKLWDLQKSNKELYDVLKEFHDHSKPIKIKTVSPNIDIETIKEKYSGKEDKEEEEEKEEEKEEAAKRKTIDFSKIKEKKPTQALLNFVRNGEDTYRLLSKVALRWHDIASVLQLEDIQNIKANKMYDDTERADHVFNEWFRNAPNLCEGKYPLTWKGLYDLLDDAGLSQIADEFFDTLEKKCYPFLLMAD